MFQDFIFLSVRAHSSNSQMQGGQWLNHCFLCHLFSRHFLSHLDFHYPLFFFFNFFVLSYHLTFLSLTQGSEASPHPPDFPFLNLRFQVPNCCYLKMASWTF